MGSKRFQSRASSIVGGYVVRYLFLIAQQVLSLAKQADRQAIKARRRGEGRYLIFNMCIHTRRQSLGSGPDSSLYPDPDPI